MHHCDRCVQLSEIASEWRDRFNKQLLRAVAAEKRAGKKNVAQLEARIAKLEVFRDSWYRAAVVLGSRVDELEAENQRLRDEARRNRVTVAW